MRILLIHRYFWPDTPPYAHILRQVALELGRAGHEVTVLTCQPSYNRSVIGRAPGRELLSPHVEVRRWRVLPDRRSGPLKGLNLAVFCTRLLTTGLRLGQVDVVMAASSPPIAVAKVASWVARQKRARFVYHKQDIYPEVALALGIVSPGPWARLLRSADARTDRAAARVVVLSEDMAKTVRARGVPGNRITVINNFDPWILASAAGADGVPPSGGLALRSRDTPLTVVFAGNLGRFQNLESVIGAAALLGSVSDVEFHFFGSGIMQADLEQRVEDEDLHHVHFHGYQAPQRVAEFLRDRADLGIVSLAPGVIRTAYPSKTMSYLRQGCPVLTLLESDSELARAISAADAGIVVDPLDAGTLAKALLSLAGQRRELAASGARARELYERAFSGPRQLAKWLALFEHIHEEQAA